MYTTYRLNANDLDSRFIKSVKAQFKDKEIEIVVSECAECDETEYLMKSEANKKRLLESLKNVKEGKNLITVDLEDLDAKCDL
ncbi:hypothetical protein ISS30_09800 [bacterium]|nr:hypothetical protein [FCB group bacterium]MBL7191977.1 hypothetical protein [bacterium]